MAFKMKGFPKMAGTTPMKHPDATPEWAASKPAMASMYNQDIDNIAYGLKGTSDERGAPGHVHPKGEGKSPMAKMEVYEYSDEHPDGKEVSYERGVELMKQQKHVKFTGDDLKRALDDPNITEFTNLDRDQKTRIINQDERERMEKAIEEKNKKNPPSYNDRSAPTKFIGALLSAASQTMSKGDKDLMKKHKINKSKKQLLKESGTATSA